MLMPAILRSTYCEPLCALKTRLQVIKVGTSSLVRPEQQTLNLSALARIAETVKALKSLGRSTCPR